MKRMWTSAALAALSIMTVSTGARAELPAVLDVIPGDATVVIATPNIGQMDTDIGNLMNLMGMGQNPTPAQLLAGVGLGPGMDMDGSAAIVMLGEAEDFQGDTPPMVAVIPTSDFEAMFANFNPKNNGGVSSFDVNGETVYARPVGGYAVAGPVEALVRGFDARAGRMADHEKMVGAQGMEIAENSDIYVVARYQPLAPLFDEMRAGMQAGMNDAFQQRAGMMGGGADMEEQVDAIEKQLDLAIFGLRADNAGAGVDMAFTFMEGGDMAAMLNGAGNSRKMLSAFPRQPFIAAYAIDLEHPALRHFTAIMAQQQEAMENMGMPGMGGGMDLGAFENADGNAMVVYPNPAGPMSGMLSNMVSYFPTKDPKAIVQSTREAMQGMADGAAGFQGSWSENETTIEGVSVSAWSMQMKPGGDMQAMQAMQAMSMMFGPQGLGGYVAATDGGVYQTMSKNSMLLGAAIRASKGGESLADEPALRQVAERLPSGRAGEWYLGVKTVVDQVGPMLAMFAPGVQLNAPADMPPIGAGVAGQDGAMRVGVFVPAQVLRFGSETYSQLQQMQQRQGGGPGDGRPRF